MANLASTWHQKSRPTEAERLEVQVLEPQGLPRETPRYSVTLAASELAAFHQGPTNRIFHTLYLKASERVEVKDAV